MMTEYTKRFYRYLAREYSISIDEFVKLTGIAKCTVLKTLNGTSTPNIATRHKLLKVLNTEELNAMIRGDFFGNR